MNHTKTTIQEMGLSLAESILKYAHFVCPKCGEIQNSKYCNDEDTGLRGIELPEEYHKEIVELIFNFKPKDT